MSDTHDRSQSRATLWAALIGGTCAIIAAFIGVSVGHRRAENRTDGLQQNLQSRAETVTALQQELEKRDADIRALSVQIQEQQRRVASLRQELATQRSPDPARTQTQSGTRDQAVDPPSAAHHAPPVVSGPLQRVERGDFDFALRGCDRRDNLVRCSLTVTNIGDARKEMSLCDASHLVDEAGIQLATRIDFGRNNCVVNDLEPQVPRAFQMSAALPAAARTVTVVLHDGNWLSFSGSAVFRNTPISGSNP